MVVRAQKTKETQAAMAMPVTRPQVVVVQGRPALTRLQWALRHLVAAAKRVTLRVLTSGMPAVAQGLIIVLGKLAVLIADGLVARVVAVPVVAESIRVRVMAKTALAAAAAAALMVLPPARAATVC